VPDDAAIIARYQDSRGTVIEHVEFYRTLAALQFSIIVLRYVDMQIAAGRMPPDTTMGTRSPVTALLATGIGLDVPEPSPDFERAVSGAAGTA
jgi:hypothetical protein